MAARKGRKSKKAAAKRPAKKKSQTKAHKAKISRLKHSILVVQRRIAHLRQTGKQECGRGSKGQ